MRHHELGYGANAMLVWDVPDERAGDIGRRLAAFEFVTLCYRRFVVPAGRHHLRARLKDHVRLPDFNYRAEAEVELKPGQVFVVDFNARTGGFIFK